MLETYFITISGFARTPEESIRSLSDVVSKGKLHVLGIDGKISRNIFGINANSRRFLEYIVGGSVSDSEIGCLLSHQKVYSSMLESGYESAFVFEDDADILISLEKLSEYVPEWISQRFDMVLLYWQKGGLVNLNSDNDVGKALIPPVGAVAYWLTSNAAKALKSQSNVFTGLADWPLTINRLRVGVFTQAAVSHSLGNSVIGLDRKDFAQHRTPFYLKSFFQLLSFNSLRNLKLIYTTVGLKIFLKTIFINRFLIKSLNIITRRKLNQTVVLKGLKISLR